MNFEISLEKRTKKSKINLLMRSSNYWRMKWKILIKSKVAKRKKWRYRWIWMKFKRSSTTATFQSCITLFFKMILANWSIWKREINLNQRFPLLKIRRKYLVAISKYMNLSCFWLKIKKRYMLSTEKDSAEVTLLPNTASGTWWTDITLTMEHTRLMSTTNSAQKNSWKL